MAETTLIALTGGPCAGKTTAMEFLAEAVKKHGVEVFCVNEQATALKRSGRTPESMGQFGFHRLLFENQLAEEERALSDARASKAEKALVLCDRGLLDSRAYVDEAYFARYAGAKGFNEETVRNRYDAVLHLVTAANGAEEHYTLSNNPARSEDIEKARALDDAVLSLWVGTQHLRVFDNRGDFRDKLGRLLAETLAVLGIPEPLEIERKLLIASPDLKLLASMSACRRVPIVQAYLNTPEEGLFRVRKRGEGENALYIKTVKHKISEMKRVEIESYISKEEFYKTLARSEYVDGVIAKDRYCFVWKAQYFELDVYPFWADRATLEIELLSEDQAFETPDFVKLIRDVSLEKKYRNKWLAVKYGKVFKNIFSKGIDI